MKMYKCYFENTEPEVLDIEELFWMIDNYYLIEILIAEGLYVRQRKDLDTQLELNGETIDMKYGKVYLTDGKNLLDIRQGRGEDELQEWIQEKSTQFNL